MKRISRKDGFALLKYDDLEHLRRCCGVRPDQAELAFVAGLQSRGYELEAAEPGAKDERAGEGRGNPSSVQGEGEGTGATVGSSSSSPAFPHDATKQALREEAGSPPSAESPSGDKAGVNPRHASGGSPAGNQRGTGPAGKPERASNGRFKRAE